MSSSSDSNSGIINNKTVYVVLIAIVSIVFFLLVLNGGMCQRYKNEMEQRDAMKKYIDSIRSKQQREIPSQ